MKKLLGLLISLSIIYILIQLGFKFLGNGHNVTYNIKEEELNFKINETYTQRIKNEKTNYFFEIYINDSIFKLQTFENFNRNEIVIKDIKYFKNNNYECIYPVFKNKKQVFDVTCKKDNIIYQYNSLKNKDSELDSFVTSLNGDYKSNNEEVQTIFNEEIEVFNSILPNHFITLNNYKGVYLINDKSKIVSRVTLFTDDIYKRPITAYSNKNYITADYSDPYNIKRFYIVDMEYGTKKEIDYKEGISYNSYIQGTVNDLVYIIDLDNKKQYEIDLKNLIITVTGNENSGYRVFDNFKFITKPASEVLTEKKVFNQFSNSNENFKWGNKKSGYYYFFEKVNDTYNVYKSPVQDKEYKMYLFQTSNINDLVFIADYIYFKEGEFIKYYHDNTGVRTVLKNKEFTFNDTLPFSVYVK